MKLPRALVVNTTHDLGCGSPHDGEVMLPQQCSASPTAAMLYTYIGSVGSRHITGGQRIAMLQFEGFFVVVGGEIGRGYRSGK